MKRFLVSLSQKNKTYAEHAALKVVPPDLLEQKVSELRASGKTIATLNGSFDLMHAGHLRDDLSSVLPDADVLIIALNTDSSVQQYKSPLRPIIQLESRIKMMAALEMVSYVTWFDETDPRRILSIIKPDVHINGAEYGENCIEAEVVKSPWWKNPDRPACPRMSTSHIIKKIVDTCV